MADGSIERGQSGGDRSPVVLLVEDEMIIAFDMADQLSEAGFVVDGPYPSNVKAATAIDAAKPSVAILDVQLVDGDVYPVADKLSALHVPIVFHSGHADPTALKRDYPGAIVCTKPCPSGDLEKAVRTVMQAPA